MFAHLKKLRRRSHRFPGGLRILASQEKGGEEPQATRHVEDVTTLPESGEYEQTLLSRTKYFTASKNLVRKRMSF